MSLLYLLAIPVVFVAWLYVSLPRENPDRVNKFAIRTSTPTPIEIGDILNARPTSRPASSGANDALVANAVPAGAVAGSADREIVYIVVTATITPTPTMTPNPYGTLHMTLTQLWHQFTVTPDLATMWAKPLYDMASGDCFHNCGFITATPRPLIYNP